MNALTAAAPAEPAEMNLEDAARRPVNEAVAALHRDIRHRTLVWRDGSQHELDVSFLVPGDVVALRVGDVVPADLQIIATDSGRSARLLAALGEGGRCAHGLDFRHQRRTLAAADRRVRHLAREDLEIARQVRGVLNAGARPLIGAP